MERVSFVLCRRMEIQSMHEEPLEINFKEMQIESLASPELHHERWFEVKSEEKLSF